MLRGDELGALLFTASLRRGLAPDAVVACSIVSSRVLSALAASAGLRHEETLTGFKWIARVPGLGYGYEEAIGYCVAPDIVRDKDGVSAALLLAWYTAELKAEGRTLLDVLDDIAVELGVYATDAFSVRVADLAQIAAGHGAAAVRATARARGVTVSRSTTSLAATAGCRRPTGCAGSSPTGRASSCDRPAPSPSSRSTSRRSSRWATPDRLAAARRTAAERLAALRDAMETLTRL